METQRSRDVARIGLPVIFAVYVMSFLLPVTDAGEPQAMCGFQAFYLALVSVIYWPMWLANPVFWFGCFAIAQRRWSTARNCGFVAFAFAISEVWLWDDPPELGYYAWSGSMLGLALLGIMMGGRPTITSYARELKKNTTAP